MNHNKQKCPGIPTYKNYPFKDKLEDRKKHFKHGIGIKRSKSGAVKFRIADICQFILDNHLENSPDAYLVFHFAAYKEEDWASYETKPEAKKSGITKKDFKHRPTLILAYENSPVSVESFDCGVICPPPPGC